MKKILLLILTVMVVMTLSACKQDDEIDEIVYVTVYPMQYLVEQIAGDTVLVKRVPGSTVHSDSIDWTGKEMIDMVSADLLFYVNAGVDTYIPNSIDSVFADGTVTLVDVSQNITYNRVCTMPEHTHLLPDVNPILDCDENAQQDDPHFWLDPVRMLIAAEYVKDQLILEFPQYTDDFEENYEGLKTDLEDLDAAYQAMADAATKPIITTVMLFTYWHERYDLEILSITTSAHSSESSASDIIYFADEAAYHNIHYILFEKNTNSPAGDGVLDELLKVDPLAERLYLHGLGNLTNEEIDENLYYLAIMYTNLAVLVKATQ